MMRSILYLLLGVAIGVGIMFAINCGRGHKKFDRSPEKIAGYLDRKLDLSDDQAKRVLEIVTSTKTEMDALKAEARPRFDEIKTRSRTAIAALLSEEQKQEFIELNRKWDERRKEWEGRP